MTSLAEPPWMPDENVWIALASNKHEHHSIAHEWIDSVTGEICFCRITQMGLLRLLTNSRVMEDDVLKPPDAVRAYEEFLSDSRVRFVAEPGGVGKAWFAFMNAPGVGASSWTDAYLAAFAVEMGFRLVTLDRGMRRWNGLAAEVLKA
jgi:toxin-antitoxin system PIN domain toxin